MPTPWLVLNVRIILSKQLTGCVGANLLEWCHSYSMLVSLAWSVIALVSFGWYWQHVFWSQLSRFPPKLWLKAQIRCHWSHQMEQKYYICKDSELNLTDWLVKWKTNWTKQDVLWVLVAFTHPASAHRGKVAVILSTTGEFITLLMSPNSLDLYCSTPFYNVPKWMLSFRPEVQIPRLM